jgi:hypothetical protein
MSVFKNHPDGSLFVCLGMCTAAVDCMDTDEAKTLVPMAILFFVLMIFKVAGAGLLAAKMYRDKSFGDKQKQSADANVIESTSTKTIVAAPGQPAKSETTTETVVPAVKMDNDPPKA